MPKMTEEEWAFRKRRFQSMRDQGMTITDMHELTGLSRSRISEVLSKDLETAREDVRQRQLRQYRGEAHRRPGKPVKWNEKAIIEAVARYCRSNRIAPNQKTLRSDPNLPSDTAIRLNTGRPAGEVVEEIANKTPYGGSQ